MQPFAYVPVLLLLGTGLACAAGQEVRHCDFDVKARCASGEARVTIANGVVNRVEVDVIWCGLPGHPAYTCTIDSSRVDPDSKWSSYGSTTVIANTSPLNPNYPDRVKVTLGPDVTIDFKEAQSLGHCGAGAELPQTLVIPARGKACRVRLGEP
jgi:hypothetical protein